MEARSPRPFDFSVRAIDTHAHVSMGVFDADRDQVIARARENGVGFIEIGFDVESSRKSIALAKSLGCVCAAGIHPHNAEDSEDLEAAWQDIEALLTYPEVRAVGEIGLDYARDYSPRPIQAKCFEMGLRLAKDKALPVIIHQRDAQDDTLRMISGANLDAPIIFHCFTGDADYALRCVRLDGYIGLGGSLTYPRNDYIRQAIPEIPRDRILLETDAPYLSPQPYRGKRNEPSYILETARIVAGILNINMDLLLKLAKDNAERAFGTNYLAWA